MSETEKIPVPPLSRTKLTRMAKDFILGPELMAEIKRLEKAGVIFHENPDAHTGPWPVSVQALLLAEEEADPSEKWDIVPQRDKALALARKDKDFLRARLEDLHYWHESPDPRYGDRENLVYVSEWDSGLLLALSRQFGYSKNDTGYYTSEEGRGDYRSVKYLLGGGFLERLASEGPSWLEIMRTKDDYIRGQVIKQLGDPADPEQVAMNLITRRLDHLVHEVDRTLQAERRVINQEQAIKDEAAAEQQLDAAWSGFFAGDTAAAGAPALEPLAAKPARERPVAPSLSEDSELTR